MTNKTKLLLSSLILTTGSIAADPSEPAASEQPPQIVLDLDKSIENNGTINMAAGLAIRVSQGNWITNNGTFNLYRANDEDKFTIIGTDSTADAGTSGINNNGTAVNLIDGTPKVSCSVSGNAYYNFKDGSGEMWVINTSTNEKKRLSSSDYEKLAGGTIKGESVSLYSFLKSNELTITNSAQNIIVLRGFDAINEGENVVSLDHVYDGVSATTEENPLNIATPFVNSESFQAFAKDNVDLDEYTQSYGLRVKGYYNFTGNNSEFSGNSVEFAEGESKVLAIQSMFPQDELNITGGRLTLDLQTYGQGDVLNFDKTINIKSHVEESITGEDTVYGCLRVTSSSDFNVAEGGVLNLGIIPNAQEEQNQPDNNVEPNEP